MTAILQQIVRHIRQTVFVEMLSSISAKLHGKSGKDAHAAPQNTAAISTDGSTSFWPDASPADQDVITRSLHASVGQPDVLRSEPSRTNAAVSTAPRMLCNEQQWRVMREDALLARAGAGVEVALQTPGVSFAQYVAEPPKEAHSRSRGNSVATALGTLLHLHKPTAQDGTAVPNPSAPHVLGCFDVDTASVDPSLAPDAPPKHTVSAPAATGRGAEPASHNGGRPRANSSKSHGSATEHHGKELPSPAQPTANPDYVLRSCTPGGILGDACRITAPLELAMPGSGQRAAWAVYVKMRAWTGDYQDYHYHGRKGSHVPHHHHFASTGPSPSADDGSTAGTSIAASQEASSTPVSGQDQPQHVSIELLGMSSCIRLGIGADTVLQAAGLGVHVWNVHGGRLATEAMTGGSGDGNASDHILTLAFPTPIPGPTLSDHGASSHPDWAYLPLGVVSLAPHQQEGAGSSAEGQASQDKPVDSPHSILVNVELVQLAVGRAGDGSAEPVAAVDIGQIVAVPVHGHGDVAVKSSEAKATTVPRLATSDEFTAAGLSVCPPGSIPVPGGAWLWQPDVDSAWATERPRDSIITVTAAHTAESGSYRDADGHLSASTQHHLSALPIARPVQALQWSTARHN